MKKIKLLERYVRKVLMEQKQESGLIVTPKTSTDAKKLQRLIDSPDFDYYAEYNSREGFFMFPESESQYDSLEVNLQDIFNDNDIDARFEGIFN